MDYLSTQNSMNTGTDSGNRSPWSCNPQSLFMFLLLLSMVCLMAYCTRSMSQGQEMVPNRPETRVYSIKADVLREALDRYMEKNKFRVDAGRSGPLHVQTEWLEDGGYRTMLVADIKPLSRNKAELKLQMLLEEKPMFHDKWEPIDEIGVNTYRRMLGDIEMECYRVLYNRS